MSDLEQRLADALADGAGRAPSSAGLAVAARSRARTRRRNRLAGAAAVVALAVGVPTAVVVGGWDGDPENRPSDQTLATDPAPPGRTLPAGFHYESWHDVTIKVPDTWRYGSLDQWCVGGELEVPVINRPGGVTTAMGCTPAQGYGVTFQEVERSDEFRWPLAQQGSGWPPDAWVGAHAVGGTLVSVSLPDINLAQQILDSVQLNTVLDPNGCPVDSTSDPVVPGEAMTVCTYDPSGELVSSELLRGGQVEEAEQALASSPAFEEPVCTQMNSAPVTQTVRLASVAMDATLVEDPNCLKLTVHGTPRTVTEDVLYWAISPGSGGSFPNDAPLPSEHRKR